ncbi:MAG: hypothetical protein JNN28_00940, partial [Saprospiraceae bacterium]|nr:hypothetical protein [Saprospiraceae bacterium]
GAATGLYVTPGILNGGDTWFFNNGTLQNAFNMGQPMSLYFAPITLDDYQFTSYEAPLIGAPPGPCVHANTAAAFEVVYLNEIKANNVSNNFGNDCIGRFTGFGGLPQYDGQETYQIEVALHGEPDTKGQVMVPPHNSFHLASILFSVPEPGIYDVVIEDGKSCSKQFQVNMSGCDASDNLILDAGEVASVPGSTACVPVNVTNFDIQSGSFSLTWDPSRLQYAGLSNFHPAIAGFFNPGTFINSSSVASGKLGVQLYNSNSPGAVISIPDGESPFDICFLVLDTAGAPCITVDINHLLVGIAVENALGQPMAVTTLPGGVCQSVATQQPAPAPIFRVSPNPIDRNTRELNIWSDQTTAVRGNLFNAMGAAIYLHDMELQPGANRFSLPGINLPAGLYYLQLITPYGATQTVRLVCE